MSDCGSNPPAPQGFAVWQGSVPKQLSDWAISLKNHSSQYAFGTTWIQTYNGKQVTARLDHHPWSHDPQGNLITGCFRGITLYAQKPTGAAFAAEDAAPNVGDPLAVSPSSDMALFDDVSYPPAGTDWTLVAISGAALVAVVGGFWWALRGPSGRR